MIDLSKRNSDFTAVSLFDEIAVNSNDGFFIKGNFYEAEDGNPKLNFWSDVLDTKNYSINALIEMARCAIMHHFVRTPTAAMTEFVLFEGIVARPFEYFDFCKKLNPKEISIIEGKAKNKNFGFFLLSSDQDDKKILVRNLCNNEALLSELAASLFVTVMSLEYSLSDLYQKDPALADKVIDNMDFIKDLILGLDVEERRILYKLMD